MGLPVKPTPLATEQIRREARWWQENRPKAPTLFREELRRAFRLISEHPEIGARAEETELTGVRRVLLAATQHYLYYVLNESARRIEVLTVWSTSRAAGPSL